MTSELRRVLGFIYVHPIISWGTCRAQWVGLLVIKCPRARETRQGRQRWFDEAIARFVDGKLKLPFFRGFYGAQAVSASASHEISHMRRRYSALSSPTLMLSWPFYAYFFKGTWWSAHLIFKHSRGSTIETIFYLPFWVFDCLFVCLFDFIRDTCLHDIVFYPGVQMNTKKMKLGRERLEITCISLASITSGTETIQHFV